MSWRRGLLILLSVLAIYVIYIFIDEQFRFENIRFPSREKNLSSTVMDESVIKILSQPFVYLDRGRQSFVFVSEDQKYVIKFFDMHRLDPSRASFFNSKENEYFKDRTERLFNGYRIAYEKIPHETGLIFIQLHSTETSTFIKLIDRFGFSHSIDLSQVPFVLQERSTPTRQVIRALLEKGDFITAKKRFESLFKMYQNEYKQGVYDPDHNFMHNTGFIGERPIHFDIGRLRYDENFQNPEVSIKDFEKIKKRAQRWLDHYFPDTSKDQLEV